MQPLMTFEVIKNLNIDRKFDRNRLINKGAQKNFAKIPEYQSFLVRRR